MLCSKKRDSPNKYLHHVNFRLANIVILAVFVRVTVWSSATSMIQPSAAHATNRHDGGEVFRDDQTITRFTNQILQIPS